MCSLMIFAVVGKHRPRGKRALPAGVFERARLDDLTHALNIFAENRGVPDTELEAVILGRIVAAGDHHTAVHFPM